MKDNSGYLIYPISDNTKQFYFNKTLGKNLQTIQENYNASTKILNTFGKYPFAYRVGNMGYRNFELTSAFIPMENKVDGTIISVNNQISLFYELVNNNETFIVETPTKEKLRCFINIKGTNVPYIYKEEDFEYLVLNIECTEIGSVD